MATWTNQDGLEVRFNLDRATVVDSGTLAVSPFKHITKKITGTELPDTDNVAADADAAFIPAGSVITRAYVYVTGAFAGATATMDLGLKLAAGTAISADGIDADIAVAALDAVGDTILCNGAYVADGNLTGVRLTADAYISASYETAAFTAGQATLVVEYLDLEA
tara:strand:- start:4205 stop:4699 length:495 start_codon:yes stop_codon:yes gene_type:complete